MHARRTWYFPELAGTTLYRLRRSMLEPGIHGKYPNASRKTTAPDEGASARYDLISLDSESPVPTYKLVDDITYLRTTSGFIMDKWVRHKMRCIYRKYWKRVRVMTRALARLGVGRGQAWQ